MVYSIKIGDIVRYDSSPIRTYLVAPPEIYLRAVQDFGNSFYPSDIVSMIPLDGPSDIQWTSLNECTVTIIGRASLLELALYGIK